MRRIVWTLLWVFIFAIVCSAQNTIYLPQIADGQAGGFVWASTVVVTNPAAIGTATASGTITFRQDNGTPFNVPFTDVSGQPVGSGNTIPFQVAGGQTRFYFSTGMPALNTGFATVTANLPVTAAAIFDEFSAATGQRIASGGVPPSAAVTHQEVVFFEGGKSDTGVAFANPSSGGVSISLQLLDTNGAALFPAVNIQLAGNNHVARFVSELFPNSRHTQGTMQIQSSSAVAAMPLYFNGDGTFFTGPVVTLASLMNPSLPALSRLRGRYRLSIGSIDGGVDDGNVQWRVVTNYEAEQDQSRRIVALKINNPDVNQPGIAAPL